MRRVLAPLGLLLLWSAPLRAHPANVGYADISVRDREVEVALSANLFELDLVLSLDRNLDAVVDPGELEARRPEILAYLGRVMTVAARGEPLPMDVGPLRVGRGRDGKALFEATARFRSAQPLGRVAIRCEPLGELGADHTTLATIRTRGRTEQVAFRSGIVWESETGGSGALLEFLKLGVIHIFTGYDHVAFLLGLLIMGGRLVTIVKIVSAFTLAHSVTLTLAALGAVSVPPALIEAGIALSIVYVAVENLFWPSFDRRWLVSFCFGLVHGFGFAAVLAEMHLPRSGLAASLVSFNIGVEVGQIVVVLLVVPPLWLVARTRAHGAMTRSVSALLLCLGLFWLWERAL